MRYDKHVQQAEAAFDGQTAAQSSSPSRPEAAQWVAALERQRAGVQAVRAVPGIDDAQLPAFIAGIRDGIEAPRRRHGGFWALVSLTAASLVMAVSMFALMTGGPAAVDAKTEVESVESDLQHTEFTVDRNENGTTTLWVTVAQEDIL